MNNFMTKIYADGYTIKGNPSKIGGGYVVMDEDKTLLHHGKIKKKGFTNNEGELLAVLKATELAKENDTIIIDSMVAYYWVMHRKCKARLDLKPLAMEAYINVKDKNLILKQEGRDNNLAGNYIEFGLVM